MIVRDKYFKKYRFVIINNNEEMRIFLRKVFLIFNRSLCIKRSIPVPWTISEKTVYNG